jgi:hypothetical protein
VWSNVYDGRYFRARTQWYRIQKVISATSLALATEFTEDDVSAGTYKIVAKQIALDPEARWISNTMIYPRFRRPLNKISMAEMDLRYPERQLVGGPPDDWCQTEDLINTDGKRCLAIEVYPYSTNAETLNYIFWKRPDALRPDAEVPNVIDGYQLKEGVLIDIAQYNAAKYAKPGKDFSIEAAAYWRNESRQQRTTWERIILDVARQDRGVDDLTFILQMTRSYGYGRGEVRTARDEVYARGNRP